MILNSILTISICFNLGIIVIEIYVYFTDHPQISNVLRHLKKFVIVELIFQAIAFSVISCFIMTKLKRHFESFYIRYKCMLLIVTIGYTVTLSTRALFALFLEYSLILKID